MNALGATALALCFTVPQPVAIDGYSGHAMEPFVSREGETLFFNSRNQAHDQTDLFWARRIDNLHFRFMGPVAGANSPQLDGVASLARDGTFAFISPRNYDREHATIWTGHWDGAWVSALHLETALNRSGPLRFNMDAEISADGARLYFSDNLWGPGAPFASDLHLGVRVNGAWRRAPEHDTWFAHINSGALEYAPATSADERELYFTRLTRPLFGAPHFEIMVATRESPEQPFGAPVAIPAISGIVEGPSVAPDGALYFHAEIGGVFKIMRAPNTCGAR